jgi:hypothetical protein
MVASAMPPTRSSSTRLARTLPALALLAACGPSAARSTLPAGAPELTRLRFNQLAMQLDLPYFWERDANGDGAPDASELRTLRFHPRTEVDAAGAIAQVRDALRRPPAATERERLVREELDRAAPTLVWNDLSTLPAAHRAFAAHMLTVSDLVDRLYFRQTGAEAMAARVADDSTSRALFRRNWGPGCEGSVTESQPACSAIEGAPRQPVDVYPASLQSDESFCATLEARPDASALLSPFTVVREEGGNLVAVPYPVAYRELVTPLVAELRAAADAIAADPAESALVAYLRAAATAWETNDWVPADEAWSRMSVRNSRWYVRIAPDETYWEPCAHKAGIHLTFALIDQGSLAWQERLTPVQRDMEAALAALASDVYRPRDVSFHMPDFIDIVVNAGDDRDAFGATIGQSLPNWGPVADEGRGRTVAMTNLYTDEDSMERRRAQAASMLSAASMQAYTADEEAGLLSTILHEATHNLGPAHEYRVNGQTDDEAFGGGLASTFEELKAQSGALYFVEWLRGRGILSDEQAKRVYVDSIVWTFGHISRGMYTPSRQRKAYSQLAAIQVGFLLDEGALSFDPDALAADGTSRGAFTLHFDRLPAACERLMARVMRIKATGNRADAEALAARHVDGDRVPHALIVERYKRFPQATFVYGVTP